MLRGCVRACMGQLRALFEGFMLEYEAVIEQLLLAK